MFNNGVWAHFKYTNFQNFHKISQISRAARVEKHTRNVENYNLVHGNTIITILHPGKSEIVRDKINPVFHDCLARARVYFGRG